MLTRTDTVDMTGTVHLHAADGPRESFIDLGKPSEAIVSEASVPVILDAGIA